MTLANHSLLEFYAWNSNGPIRCNRYVAAAKRGKTRVSRSHDPFEFYFWLVETAARRVSANHKRSNAKPKQLQNCSLHLVENRIVLTVSCFCT